MGPGQAGKTLANSGDDSGAGCLVLGCLVVGTGRLGIFFGGWITGVLVIGHRLNRIVVGGGVVVVSVGGGAVCCRAGRLAGSLWLVEAGETTRHQGVQAFSSCFRSP